MTFEEMKAALIKLQNKQKEKGMKGWNSTSLKGEIGGIQQDEQITIYLWNHSGWDSANKRIEIFSHKSPDKAFRMANDFLDSYNANFALGSHLNELIKVAEKDGANPDHIETLRTALAAITGEQK